MTRNSELFKPQTAAEIIGVQVGTLAAWRYRGIGPEFVRLNRSVYYPARSLAAFLKALPRGGVPAKPGGS
jgi:hypothetical protein